MTVTALVRPTSPANKRGDVVEGARRALLRYGFDRATIALIAVEAGVTRQTVYAHFGNRQYLFEEVALMARDHASRQMADLCAHGCREVDDFEWHLRHLTRAMLRDSLSEDNLVLRCLAQAGVGRRDRMGDRRLDANGSLNQLLTQSITVQVERGSLDVRDVQEAVRNLYSIVMGEAVIRWQNPRCVPTPEEIDRVADGAVNFWLRAYASHVGQSWDDRPRSERAETC